MKKLIITPLCLLLFIGLSYGQDEEITKYTEIDLKVKDKWIRSNDIYTIAETITYDYEDDESKVRAIFVWVTDNIEYSLETLDEQKKDRSKRRIKAKDPDEKAELEKELKDNDLKKCLKRRGGVVTDYTYLFTELCDAVGIEAGEVKGYLRRSERKVGQMPRRPDHIWNWARIDGKKYLFDTMLAAGKVGKNPDTKEKEFMKEFNDIYFMTPPEIMILNHYPLDKKNQLIDEAVSEEEFANYPFILPGFKSCLIEEFHPKSGLIAADQTEIEFKIKFKDGEIPNRIMIYERRKLSEQEFVRDGDYFVLKYKIPEVRPRMLKIVIKGSKLYEHEAMVYIMATE